MYFSDSVSHISLFILVKPEQQQSRGRVISSSLIASTIVSNSSSSINPPSRSRNTVERMGKSWQINIFWKLSFMGAFGSFCEVSGPFKKFQETLGNFTNYPLFKSFCMNKNLTSNLAFSEFWKATIGKGLANSQIPFQLSWSVTVISKYTAKDKHRHFE